MSSDTKNLIFWILAIIGGIVVLGWLLKVAFKLIGVAIVVGLILVGVVFVQKMMGKR